MSVDQLNIYVDRLRGGGVEQIEAMLSPSLLHSEAEEMHFPDPIIVVGKAYVAGEYLVLCLTIGTTACVPCKICGEPTEVPIRLEQNYTMEELSRIRGAIFNGDQLVRELVLLEVPRFAECHGGNCPLRDEIAPFLKEKE